MTLHYIQNRVGAYKISVCKFCIMYLDKTNKFKTGFTCIWKHQHQIHYPENINCMCLV